MTSRPQSIREHARALLVLGAPLAGGNLAYVGLVVPHALRPFVGTEHGRLLPAAFLGGATFVMWADVFTRLIPSAGTVPLGVVTSLVGGPVFLVLLMRATREGSLA